MIRPLRRRHRWIIPVLFSLLAGAAWLAHVHRMPSPVVEALPQVIAGAEGATGSR